MVRLCRSTIWHTADSGNVETEARLGFSCKWYMTGALHHASRSLRPHFPSLWPPQRPRPSILIYPAPLVSFSGVSQHLRARYKYDQRVCFSLCCIDSVSYQFAEFQKLSEDPSSSLASQSLRRFCRPRLLLLHAQPRWYKLEDLCEFPEQMA